jgi:type II restriction enzyme
VARKITAKELYNELLRQEIKSSCGSINFNMADVSVTIDTTDTVGHILQSWLKQWLIDNDYYFNEPSNTQVFPDFYLDTDVKKNLLEVKAFNYNASPAFDIANFESYCSSLAENAYRLDADYLIFGYSMNNGVIKIEDIWLKKIWEISSSSAKYPLRVQDKRGMIYNIRPTKWYSSRATPSFDSKENFIIAIYNTLKKYSHTSIEENQWIYSVVNNYKNYTGSTLKIRFE